MARPRKPRSIADDAPSSYFKPRGIPLVDLREEVLQLDGLEALRLVDVEGLDQQAAAAAMGVSRSTLSRILKEGRRAVATAISRGMALRVEGGVVTRPRGGDCQHRPIGRADGEDQDATISEGKAKPTPEDSSKP